MTRATTREGHPSHEKAAILSLLTLQLEESELIVSWNDFALGEAFQLLQSLSGAEPVRVPCVSGM
jgi:hypothetical protein